MSDNSRNKERSASLKVSSPLLLVTVAIRSPISGDSGAVPYL